MKYKVRQDYKSGAAGPFDAGTVIDLDEDLAEHIERDSPGTLWPVGVPEPGLEAMRAAVSEGVANVVAATTRRVGRPPKAREVAD